MPLSAEVPLSGIATPKGPAFEKWMKEVAALPAEKQVEAVAKKLQERKRSRAPLEISPASRHFGV
jgi:hypothetical protein